MVTVITGLVGGLLGSIVTGAILQARDDDPGPAVVVWAKYLGDGDPTNYARQGTAVHLAYGAVAGAVFVLLAGGDSLGVATLGEILLWTTVWSAALAVVAVGVWMLLVLGERPDTDALAPLALVHLVFGVVLGLVVAVAPPL